MKKSYIQPEISFENIEDEDLMISMSHTDTKDYTNDPAGETSDDITINPNPAETPGTLPEDWE